jgi:hypothetical protein
MAKLGNQNQATAGQSVGPSFVANGKPLLKPLALEYGGGKARIPETLLGALIGNVTANDGKLGLDAAPVDAQLIGIGAHRAEVFARPILTGSHDFNFMKNNQRKEEREECRA